jgi:hypothetical protein
MDDVLFSCPPARQQDSSLPANAARILDDIWRLERYNDVIHLLTRVGSRKMKRIRNFSRIWRSYEAVGQTGAVTVMGRRLANLFSRQGPGTVHSLANA